MKRSGLVLLAMVMALPLLATEESLVGRWEQVERQRGSNAQIFEFKGGGNLAMGWGASVDGTWKREGEKVSINTGDGSAAGFVINSVNATTLTRSAATGGQQGTLTRVGAVTDPKNPLAGTWVYDHERGGKAYEILDADGTYHFRYSLGEMMPGYFKLKGEKMTIKFHDLRVMRLKYAMRGDKLVLIDDAGRETLYRRALY